MASDQIGQKAMPTHSQSARLRKPMFSGLYMTKKHPWNPQFIRVYHIRCA